MERYLIGMHRRGILPLAEAFGPGINRPPRRALEALNGIADRSHGSETDPGKVARHDFHAGDIRIHCSAVKRLHNVNQPGRLRAFAREHSHVCRDEPHGVRLNDGPAQIEHHYGTGTNSRRLRLRPVPERGSEYEDSVKDHIQDKPAKKIEASSDPA